MSFTDGDLKRLKESLFKTKYQANVPPLGMGLESINALLDRLEAAERAAEDTGSPELYKAWLKSKGERE